jgi:ankyrin repeat protein
MRKVLLLLSVTLLTLLTSGRVLSGIWKSNHQSWLNSALLAAISGRHFGQARELLQEGADPNAAQPFEPPDDSSSSWGATALMLAVEEGDMATVRALLRGGASVQTKDRLGTPLLWHVNSDRDDIARLLLEKGALIEGRTAWGWGDVVEAVITGQPKTLRLVLMNGGDPNERGADGLSALQCALRNKDRRSARILREFGAQ